VVVVWERANTSLYHSTPPSTTPTQTRNKQTRRDETYRTAHHQNDSVETKELDWPFHDAMLHKGSAKSQQLLSAWEIQQNTYKHEAPNNSEHVNSLEAISFLQINDRQVPSLSHRMQHKNLKS
jgi:hypothetical protein